MYVNFLKIVRAFALSCKKKKAVLTIEAAAVLPLLLISTMSLMTLISVYYINGRIAAAVNEEAKYVAMKYFSEGYSEAAVQADIEERLGQSFVNSSFIKSIDYSGTDLTDGEVFVIAADYIVKAPFAMFSMYEIPFNGKAVIHSWNGYIHGINGVYDDSEYVYMTRNGMVYHRSRECSHIRLSISAVSGKNIKNLRNESGSKYKKCDYCHPKLKDEKLYITTDGDRYHNTLMCPGLKRSIVRVKLTDIGEIEPCSRCGY